MECQGLTNDFIDILKIEETSGNDVIIRPGISK
jgi:hypothetical protein